MRDIQTADQYIHQTYPGRCAGNWCHCCYIHPWVHETWKARPERGSSSCTTAVHKFCGALQRARHDVIKDGRVVICKRCTKLTIHGASTPWTAQRMNVICQREKMSTFRHCAFCVLDSAMTYELGQPKQCKCGGLAMPRSWLRVWTCDFLTRCWSYTNQQMGSLPFIFPPFFCPRDMTDTMIRKHTKATITCLRKKITKGRLPICAHMRFKYEVTISDRNSQNWAEHGKNATCSLLLVLYVHVIVVLVVSLDGWRIGQYN